MPDTAPEQPDSPPVETPSSMVWAVSVTFWLSLLLATVLYGTVAVAPRLHQWIQARHDYLNNAHRLSALEAEVDYLERVRSALQTDPDFVRRMASLSDASEPQDTEVIPVNGSLMFGSAEELQLRLPRIDEPRGMNIIRYFAADTGLRQILLGSASLLVIFSFTVLNGSGGWFARFVVSSICCLVRIPLQRYRRKQDPAAADSDDLPADALLLRDDPAVPVE